MLTRILAAAAASLSLLGIAGAAQAAQSAAPAPPFPQLNLHSAYERALPHATTEKKGGVVYAFHKAQHAPASSKPHGAASGGTAASCGEPDCPLQYFGGPVQHTPHVYLLLWGPTWATNTGEEAAAAYLKSFYQGLGVTPQDTWSGITSQYGDGSGAPTFSGPVYVTTYNDTSAPPAGVDQLGLAAEADAFAKREGIANQPGSINDQIVIATQSGTCPSGFYAPNCDSGNGYYCAYHSYSPVTGVTYTNLPYLPEAGVGYLSACGSGWVSSPNDGFSIVGGHEYAETVTDPQPPYGWIDGNDYSGGEIGDKCAWADPVTANIDITTVALSTGTFAMQPIFSNRALSATGDGCVLSTTADDTVTVHNPYFLLSAAHKALRYQVRATDSAAGQSFTYSALGLPPGLSVNATTGLVTGRPSTAGTYLPTLIATDGTRSSSSATFMWQVVGGHPMKGYKGRCAATDTTQGSPAAVFLHKCNGAVGQLWAVGRKNSLRAAGFCLTAPFSGRVGRVALEPCGGMQVQRWTHRSNGEWVVAPGHHRLCLTDPRDSTRNGTMLTVAACKNTANQHWTKP